MLTSMHEKREDEETNPFRHLAVQHLHGPEEIRCGECELVVVCNEIANARIADVTGVLYHYKFLGRFREHAARAVREENYWENSAEYKAYLEVLDENPALRVRQETSQEIGDAEELVEKQFLVVSDDYLRWVAAEEEKSALLGRGESRYGPTEALLESRRCERAKTLSIQRLGRRLRDRDRKIWGLEQEVRDLERDRERQARRGGELEWGLRDRDRTISGLEQEVQKLNRRRKRQARRARKLERELHAVRSSRAWRLMTRVRRLMASLRRAKAGVLGRGRGGE